MMYEHADTIVPLAFGSVNLHGRLGDTLRLSINNRLKRVDYSHLVDPFRQRNERDGKWRCEFWGKIVRSAILSLHGQPDAELLTMVKDTVRDLLSTQTPDGCISSYPAELQTKDWDLWGRKYILLGLARYYLHIEQSETVRQAMIRMLDHLMAQVNAEIKPIIQYGHHSGLAASSLLEPVVLVYRITQEPRFLAYAQWIADQGGSTTSHIFDAVLDGIPPRALGNGKAYEMMSCFEGLCELYRETGNPRYLESACAFYRAVRDEEIFITGVGGLKDQWGEYWDEGRVRQTRFYVGALGETCVTTTWIKYCGQILRLTGDAAVVDEMERTLYNGVLGGITQDGSWWMHRNPTPLAGAAVKMRAGDQIPGYGEDCCLAQGPKALAMAPWLAVMEGQDGPVINLYEAASVSYELPAHGTVTLEIEGDYPCSPDVSIRVSVDKAMTFTLNLRIPQWSDRTKVVIGDERYEATSGSYLKINRNWQSSETIEIHFDMPVRVVRAYDGSGRVAFLRGPVVLAQDSRLGAVDAPVCVGGSSPVVVDRLPSPDHMYDRYVLPDGTQLCDYASAGNEFSDENTLCVWMRLAGAGSAEACQQ